MSEDYDAIIVGGGPAALAAAIYTGRGELRTLLLERLALGGQVAQTHAIDNYPGFPEGIDGPSLTERMAAQAKRFGAEIKTQEVIGIELDGRTKVVKTAEGTYRAPTLILAMGADPRKLGVPGEEELRGEAVIALEQIGAPESIKAIRAALGKEKDPTIKKNLYRALGAVGGDDSQARKALLKQAQDKRNELWRLNALIALGSLAPDEAVDQLLLKTLTEGTGLDPVAAALAMAITRNDVWVIPLSEKGREPGLAPELGSAIEKAIGVLRGQPFYTIMAAVRKTASDQVVRRRVFGGE